MQSALKAFFKNEKLNDIPGIEGLRVAKSTNEIVELSRSGIYQQSNKLEAYPIALWVTDVTPEKSLLKLDANLLDVTKFYFNLFTHLGCKPFESFILNKTYSEDINYSGTRREFMNYLFEWCPFLRELIIDTCNFIITGQRDINIRILYGLSVDYMSASEDSDVLFPELNVKQRFQWEQIESLTSQEFFTAWVGRKGGIQDLICSYKLMLGL